MDFMNELNKFTKPKKEIIPETKTDSLTEYVKDIVKVANNESKELDSLDKTLETMETTLKALNEKLKDDIKNEETESKELEYNHNMFGKGNLDIKKELDSIDNIISENKKTELELMDSESFENEDIERIQSEIDNQFTSVIEDIKETEAIKENLESEDEETEKTEFKITDFVTVLGENDLPETIELIFNFDKLEWNNFESLIKKTKLVNNTFYNMIITDIGFYLISFLDFDNSVKPFNVIHIKKSGFKRYNYYNEKPLLLSFNSTDFVNILQIIKKKSKDTEKQSEIALRILRNKPDRLMTTIINADGKKVSYGIPFHLVDFQTNSFEYNLINLICNLDWS